ncbi:MAG: type II toxin-antitoxin system VapC family toxin [Legionellales bacterium]
MILLDTCVLIYDAITPEKLSATAKKTIDQAYEKKQLCCSDISLWKIAMLIQKKRIEPGIDSESFLQILLDARNIKVLSINIPIAVLSTEQKSIKHFDPADRIVVATALHHHLALITPDKKIADIHELKTIW